MANYNPVKPMYLYDIPYSKRLQLSRMLDVEFRWRELAARLEFSAEKVHYFTLAYSRAGGSPTESLLLEWGHTNATVDMLVFHLIELKLFRAAEVFRGLVPDDMFSSIDDAPLVFPNVSSAAAAAAATGAGSSAGLPLPPPPPRVNPDVGIGYMNVAASDRYAFDHANKFTNGTMKTDISSYTCSDNFTGNTYRLSEPDASTKTLYDDAGHQRRSQPVESLDVDAVAGHHESPLRYVQHVLPSSSYADASRSGIPPSVIQYKYTTLLTVTKNFAADHLIGCGDFGAVYRGRVSNTELAIKRMYKTQDRLKDFIAEINILHKYRHPNICMLYGCSTDGPEICLVYEYMVNGSLRDNLTGKNGGMILQWHLRQKILMEVACGLNYLHSVESKPVIHGDIKSTNILLGSHFEAKIADFGLAREATGGSEIGVYTHVTVEQQRDRREKYAYLPPEFIDSNMRFRVTTDVYSFGVVIYETCTGLKVFDISRQDGALLTDLIEAVQSDESRLLQLKDNHVSSWPTKAWLTIISLGRNCTVSRRKDRPSMSQIQRQLEQVIAGTQFHGDHAAKEFVMRPKSDYDMAKNVNDKTADFVKLRHSDPLKGQGFDRSSSSETRGKSCNVDSDMKSCSNGFVDVRSGKVDGGIDDVSGFSNLRLTEDNNRRPIGSHKQAEENEPLSPLALVSKSTDYEDSEMESKKHKPVPDFMSDLLDDDFDEKKLREVPRSMPTRTESSPHCQLSSSSRSSEMKYGDVVPTLAEEDQHRAMRLEQLKAASNVSMQK